MWPTAKLSDGEGGRIIPTELNEGGFRSLRKKSNQWFGSKLRDAVETHEEKNWPTPRTGNPSSRKKGTGGKVLNEEAKEQSWPTLKNGLPDQDKSNTSGKNPGRLNPNWVEQLMCLPFVGWTQLPTEWTG